MIAIPFDALPESEVQANEEVKLIRVRVLEELLRQTERRIKPLHLLGCATPKEFSCHQIDLLRQYVRSIDTSAPIVYGWSHIIFQDRELVDLHQLKPSDKIAENLNIKLDQHQVDFIAHNVKAFRKVFTC